MSYTIYPDELFVTNLVMDYYLLRLVKKLCGGRAGVLASLGGAAFGALSYCMLILLPVSFPVNTLLAYVAINTIMVRFGCGLRTPGRLCGGIAGLYVAVTLDAMYLENENVQKVIHAPVVAFSGEDSSAFGDCQMILHPNLIDS